MIAQTSTQMSIMVTIKNVKRCALNTTQQITTSNDKLEQLKNHIARH